MQPDMNQLLRNVQKMQDAVMKLQNELATQEVEGSAGGGAVTIKCTGTLDFKGVKIKPEAADPADIETLEDLVLMAIKDACEKAKELGAQKANQSGLNLPPGLGF